MRTPAAETDYQYRGDLRETALPEMLYTIYRHRVPGLIEAEKGQVTKRVYIRDGAVIHAASSDRDDSLGVYLLRGEKISEEQFTATMAQRTQGKKRHGELLVEQGILSPAELHTALQEQIEWIVRSLFSWEEGRVSFSIGEFEEADMIRIHLPLRRVILTGVLQTPTAKSLVGRLGRRETVFSPDYITEELIEIALTEDQYELLKLVDGKRSLYELCTHGPFSAPENARLLYAFFVLKLIRRSVDQKTGVVKIRYRPTSHEAE